VSVDVVEGTTTGISAADRAVTIQRLAARTAKVAEFMQPGHVFPLRAREGGVLERAGQTEAAVDLCRIANLRPVAAISGITKDDGATARGEEVHRFARTHRLPLLTISEIVEDRLTTESVIARAETVDLRLASGRFVM